jgi:hypothetical protein
LSSFWALQDFKSLDFYGLRDDLPSIKIFVSLCSNLSGLLKGKSRPSKIKVEFVELLGPSRFQKFEFLWTSRWTYPHENSQKVCEGEFEEVITQRVIL